MFKGDKAFNHDVSGWDVSKVKTMHRMFAEFGYNDNRRRAKVGAAQWNGNRGKLAFNQDLNGWSLGTAMDASTLDFIFDGATSMWPSVPLQEIPHTPASTGSS